MALPLDHPELVHQWIHLNKDGWPSPTPEAIYCRTFRAAGEEDEFLLDLYTYFAAGAPAADTFVTEQQKLAALRETIGERHYMLVLDGLEHLQISTRGDRFGIAANPVLSSLLRALVEGRMGQGLSVITSRLALTDLKQYANGRGYQELAVKSLTDEESRLLLEREEVTGTETDLDALVRLGGGHRSCPGAWCKSVALYAAPGG